MLLRLGRLQSGKNTLLGKITSNGWEGNVVGNVTGNASTATSTGKFTTARNITIGSAKKSFDGTSDISFSLSDIGASASGHTHNYASTYTLPLMMNRSLFHYLSV